MATASQQALQLVCCNTRAQCNLCALDLCQKSGKTNTIAKCSTHINNISRNLSDVSMIKIYDVVLVKWYHCRIVLLSSKAIA